MRGLTATLADFYPQQTYDPMKRRTRRPWLVPGRYASYLRTVLVWLEVHLVHSSSLHLGLRVLDKYLKVLQTRGKREAITYCRDARTAILSWLAASDISNNSIEPPSRFGVPYGLRFLGREVKGPKDYPLIRLVLSALYASRELTLPPVANVESITSPPKGRLEGLDNYVSDFWDDLGVKPKHRRQVPKCVFWRRFHLTTKTGPNGHALWHALTDLYSLPDSLFASICRLGGDELYTRMVTLRNLRVSNFLHRYFTGAKTKRIRKVSAISSQEGKTREVAILDYWSQTALYGLHRYLFGILKRIPQDCTFNQGSFLEKLPFDREVVDKFYSIDLTAATDRFPIDLISKLLSERFGDAYVKDWRDVMVGYPFWTREHGYVSYATGNPMGAYSSWNSFALTHHYVIYRCCRELNLDWKKARYVILGDDVVINNDAIAKKYMETLALLGVEFSVAKTHTSPFMYEFAKRVVHSGVELTPFPISALWSTRKQRSLQLGLLDSEQSKGWCYAEGIPSALTDLCRRLHLPSRARWKVRRVLFITHQLMRAMRGEESALTAMTAVVDSYFPNVKITEACADAAIKFSVLTLLKRSFDTLGKGGPLGDLAVDLTFMILDAVQKEEPVLIPGRVNAEIDPSTIISAVPVLGVFGQIEGKYTQIRESVDTLDKLVAGDWKTTFKSLQLPATDRVFYIRNQDIRVQASFALTKVLISLLERAEGEPGWFVSELTNHLEENPVTGESPVWNLLSATSYHLKFLEWSESFPDQPE